MTLMLKNATDAQIENLIDLVAKLFQCDTGQWSPEQMADNIAELRRLDDLESSTKEPHDQDPRSRP